MIKREMYLKKIRDSYDSELIKIIVGVRRSGKSVLMMQIIDELKEKIGIKKAIKDYVPDEKDFLDRLDAMCEQAFDDQCTGANPRYPLISEIKDMYLRAYYGK